MFFDIYLENENYQIGGTKEDPKGLIQGTQSAIKK